MHSFRVLVALLLGLTLVSCAPVEEGTGPKSNEGPALIDVSIPAVTLAGVEFTETVSVLVRADNGAVLGDSPVAWTTDNPGVVEVTGNGSSATIKARGAGSARIRATAGRASAEISVRVLAVRAVSIVQANPVVRAGESLVLSATVEGDNGVPQSVKWTTDNAAIATINSQGVLTGVAEGSTQVKAAAVGDPRIVASIAVTITQGRVVHVMPAATLLWVGDTRTLTADPETKPGESRTVGWTSENPSVATVNAAGTVTAVSVGITKIRAALSADSRVKGEALVQVLPARRVTVSPTAAVVTIGGSQRLAANVTIEEGLSSLVLWRSADPSIVSVTGDGTVTGVSLGTTTITAVSLSDTLRKGSATVHVQPSIRGVEIDPTTMEIIAGQRDSLFARVDAEGTLARTVAWRSSNTAVATVSSQGVVTAISPGQTTVTALSTVDTTHRATAAITVRAKPEVSIAPLVATIPLNGQRAFAASVNAPGMNTAVQWRSSNSSVATINQEGIVTGIAPGSATITVLAVADTTRRATASVTIVPVVREVSLSQASGALFTGTSLQLTATVDADPGLSRAVAWRTSNSAVATVSGSGLVTAVANGSATITAVSVADTSKRASASVTITTRPVEVSVTPGALSLLPTQSASLVASVTGSSGINTGVTWSTSSSAVATVSASGIVTAVSAGSATVTATSVADPAKSASAVVTVSTRPVEIAVSPGALSLAPSQTSTLVAVVSGNPGISTAVTWTSSNAAVATVGSSGIVTAIANGSATITATAAADPAKSATVSVTVTSRLASAWAASRLSGALHEDIVAVAPFSNNSAFVINLQGDVYRWDGTNWTLVARGSQFSTRFQAVHGSSATNVIAVGTGGVIVRYDGTFWSQMTSGTTATLYDVFVDGASSAYAVGTGGTILRLTGSSWAAQTSGSTATLNGVWAGGGSAVAVGGGGEVLRTTGGAWQRQSVPTTETLYGVAGASATSVVAVGTLGTVIRFNGSAWTAINSGTESDLFAVGGSSANGGRMYIASDDGLLQLNGTTITAAATPYASRMFSATVDGTGQLWAGGQRGSVYRGAPGSFITVNLAPDLLDVWTTAANNAWAVGEFGFIYRWNGTTWQRQSTPTTVTLNSVWAASATEAFAAGDNGVVLRWNGTTWSAASLPVTASVYALWGTSATNVYAVTAEGGVYRYNGASWTSATSTSGALWAIYGLTANEIYVSGENGTLLRYNGTSWSTVTASGGAILAGLWSSGASNILTVGADGSGSSGVGYRYDGSSWSTQSMGTSRVLTSVWGPSSSDVYATGDQGTILRYNGSSWSAMATGTTEWLWSVSGSPTGVGGAFAVGYNATMVTGSSAGGSLVSAARTATRGSLEPAAAYGQARARGPLPDGAARRHRKSTAGRAGATVRTIDVGKFTRSRRPR